VTSETLRIVGGTLARVVGNFSVDRSFSTRRAQAGDFRRGLKGLTVTASSSFDEDLVEIFDQLEIMPSRRVRVARLLGWKAGGSRLKGSDARALEDGFKILGPVTLDSRIST